MSQNALEETAVASTISVMRAKYPTIFAYLDTLPKGRVWRGEKRPDQDEDYARTLDFCEQCSAEEAIPNVRYAENKQYINRILYDAWTHFIDAKYMHAGRYEQFNVLPEKERIALRSLSHPELHKIESLERRVQALNIDHPIKKDMLDFLAEVRPLGTLFAHLKTVAVKRVVRTDAEREPDYTPPIPSTPAQKIVLGALMAITEPAYVQLVRLNVMEGKREAGLFTAFKEEAASLGQPMNLTRAFGRDGKMPSPYLMASVSKLVQRSPTEHYAEELRPDYLDIIAEVAEQDAKAVRAVFLHRNLRKIAPIVDAKGNLKSVTPLPGTHVSITGLEAQIAVVFDDSSSFEAKTSVVHHQNQSGTRYHRVPVLFQNAWMPDGTKMPEIDEENMNKVFAVAQATPAPAAKAAKKAPAKRPGMAP